MDSDNPAKKRLLSILPFLLIAGLVLVPVGIGFLCTINTTETITEEHEYLTNCYDDDFAELCTKHMKAHPKCNCKRAFNVTQNITGDITLYYELESFDQTDPSYANSRDNNQLLSGKPSLSPSKTCGDFSFDEENKPIFPCGKVADTMFNDSFTVLTLLADPKVEIPITYTGILLDDTATPYRNPSAESLKDFVKPKNWNNMTGNVWENSSSISGVENPAFRAWMNTNLKRKPVWKVVVNQSLPAGPYEMRIDVFYPPDVYNGPRKFILEGVRPVRRQSFVVIGTISLITGIVFVISSLALLFISKRQDQPSRPSSYNAATLPVSDRLRNAPRAHDHDDISEEARLNRNH